MDLLLLSANAQFWKLSVGLESHGLQMLGPNLDNVLKCTRNSTHLYNRQEFQPLSITGLDQFQEFTRN